MMMPNMCQHGMLQRPPHPGMFLMGCPATMPPPGFAPYPYVPQMNVGCPANPFGMPVMPGARPMGMLPAWGWH